MQVEENKEKDEVFTDDYWSDDERFDIWLEEYCEVSPDSKRIRIETTNSEVWDILCEAKRRGFFTTESLGDLIHFRQVVIDCFYLLDDDDDKKLRKCSVDSDLQRCEGDLNDKFWMKLKDCLPDSKIQKEWIKSFEERAERDLDFHDF